MSKDITDTELTAELERGYRQILATHRFIRRIAAVKIGLHKLDCTVDEYIERCNARNSRG